MMNSMYDICLWKITERSWLQELRLWLQELDCRSSFKQEIKYKQIQLSPAESPGSAWKGMRSCIYHSIHIQFNFHNLLYLGPVLGSHSESQLSLNISRSYAVTTSSNSHHWWSVAILCSLCVLSQQRMKSVPALDGVSNWRQLVTGTLCSRTTSRLDKSTINNSFPVDLKSFLQTDSVVLKS